MLKKLLSETVLYGISTILTRLINYALVPLHVWIFKPEGYGIVSYFYSYAALFNVIYSYGMETAYFRFASKPGAQGQQVFNQVTSSLLVSSLLLSGLLWMGAPEIASWLHFDNSAQYVRWFAMLFAIDALLIAPFARLRIEHRAWRFVSLRMVEVLLTVLLNVFFLVFCRQVYEGAYLPSLKPLVAYVYDPAIGLGYTFLANLLAKAFILLMMGDYLLSWRWDWSWERLRPYYAYSIPLLISGVAYTINEVADRQLLLWWLPEGFYPGEDSAFALGVYSANYKISIFITLAVQAYKYAAEPFFFSKASDRNSPQLFAQAMRYFVIACMLMMVAVCANLDWIGSLVLAGKKDYLQGLAIVPYLLMANIFLGVFYNLSVWFKLTDRTQYGAWLGIAGAFVTIAANFLLIPRMGYLGSAWATMCSYGTMMVLCYWLGQRYFPVPYYLRNALVYMGVGGLVGWGMTRWHLPSLPMDVLLKNGLLLLGLLLAIWTERRHFLGLLKGR